MGTEFKIEDLSYSGSAYTFRAGSALLPTTRLSSIRSYISALEYQTASGLSAIFFVGLFLPGNSGLQGTGITTDPKEFVRRLISVVISRPSRVCLRLDAVVLLHHRVCALCPRLWKLFLGIFIAYGLKRIFQIPSEAAASFKPFLPNGAGGVVIAMGLTFIAFEGYDLIATVAEEIKASEKTIPRATLISLAVTVFIYLMILLVCIGAIQPESGKSWEFLGQYQETAIARAAQRFMPFFGVALIIFGGLLSTISALNATILASSRVAFSMSRDKMLPMSLSRTHAQRRTPHIAIAVTGAIVLVMGLLFPLMKLPIPIAKANGGEIIVLSVIDVPINLPPHEGMRFVHHKTPLLRKAIDYANGQGVATHSAIRIAHQVWDGILHAAEAEKATLVLMGWKGYTSTRDRIMGEVTDKVVRYAPCDLVTVKLMGDQPIRRILITTAGGPHATLAAEYVGIYHDAKGCEVTCCFVVEPNAGQDDQETARQWIQKTIRLTNLSGKADMCILQGKRVATTLVRAATDYDLVVLGASKEGVFSNVLFGEIPEKVARYSQSPVMIVTRYEGPVKSLVKRVMG
jgi:nucleotide-binding universal stress UspA family protein